VEQSTNGALAGGLPAGAESIEEALAVVENMVGELAALTDPEVLDGWNAPGITRLAEAHSRIRRLTARLDGVRYTLLPRIEADGSWRSGGMARAFTTWLRLREGVSASTAGKDMTIARRLTTALPGTRERLVAGTLGIDHAKVMTDVAPTSETRQDALAWLIDTRTGETTTPEQFVQTVAVDFPDPAEDPDGEHTRNLITQVLEDAVTDGTLVTGEGLVLREASLLNADQFRVVARRFATITDPDTDDTDDDKAAQGEFLDLAKTFGGYHLAGFLTDEHGLLVSTAINAIIGAPAAEDPRTSTQRRAQGLADLARVVLDTNQASPGAAIPPHLNVTVSWTELIAQATRTRKGLCLTCGQATPGPATPGFSADAPDTGTGVAGTLSMSGLLSGGGPVFTETGDRAPRALLRRLACDSAVTRVVFGPDGAVLDVGRAQRTVTGQMRRAVIARDRHCVFPGCDQPPSRCEVHHAITHWAHGGNTSVSNSALLCWYHHQLVDTQGITMHWTGKPLTGTTTITGPGGTTTTRATSGTTDGTTPGMATGTTVDRTTTGAAVSGALLETGWAFTDARGHRITLPEPLETPPESEVA
jgi:hypothetical protein